MHVAEIKQTTQKNYEYSFRLPKLQLSATILNTSCLQLFQQCDLSCEISVSFTSTEVKQQRRQLTKSDCKHSPTTRPLNN